MSTPSNTTAAGLTGERTAQPVRADEAERRLSAMPGAGLPCAECGQRAPMSWLFNDDRRLCLECLGKMAEGLCESRNAFEAEANARIAEVRSLSDEGQRLYDISRKALDDAGVPMPVVSVIGEETVTSLRIRRLAAMLNIEKEEFKVFHYRLCQRFGYNHDLVDWKRDLTSLEEWIAARFDANKVRASVTTLPGAVERARESARLAELDLRAAVSVACTDKPLDRTVYLLLFALVEKLCPIANGVSDVAAILGEKEAN